MKFNDKNYGINNNVIREILFLKNLRDVYMNLANGVKSSFDFEDKKYTSSLLDFNGDNYQDRVLVSLDSDVSALDKKLIYSDSRAALWFVKAEVYETIANNEILYYDKLP